MPIWEIFLVSLALAADAFSVGAAVGLTRHAPRQLFRLSFHFGLFQSLFTLIGLGLGRFLIGFMEQWAPWVAFLILAGLGLKMIFGKSGGDGDGEHDADPTRGLQLVGFSAAVSIDAMAAGFGMSAVHAPVALAVIMIGVTSAVATLVAMLLAGQIAARFGKRLEPVAGVVLIGIGLKIILEHFSVL